MPDPPLPLSARDLERIKVVAEDLEHLGNAWTMQTPEAALRRESVLLRKLLVEGEYRRSWRLLELPTEPMIRASDLREFVIGIPDRQVLSALAPLPESWPDEYQIQTRYRQETTEGDLLFVISAKTPGLAHGVFKIPVKELGPDPDADARVTELRAGGAGEQVNRHYMLSEFMDSPAVIFDGVRYSRQIIIKYVANRKGGAHLGGGRNGRDKALYDALDKVDDSARGMTFPYLELLAIGQVLADSSDAHRLRNAAEKALKSASKS